MKRPFSRATGLCRTVARFGLALGLFSSLLLVTFAPATGKVASPEHRDNSCWDTRNPNWRVQDTWAWHQLCLGQLADLADYSQQPDAQTLSAEFMVDVLGNPRYRDVLPFGQIYIRHAHFISAVNLSDAAIARNLRLDDCTFAAGLSLARASSSAPISLNNVRVEGTLNVAEFHGTTMFLLGVSASLGVDAHDMALTGNLRAVLLERSELDLDRATVEGYVEVEGSLGSLQLRAARLQNLIITTANLNEVNADSAHLRSISLSRVTIGDKAYLENAKVEEGLIVSLSRIGFGRVDVTTATDPCYSVARALDADNAVFGSVLLSRSKITGFSLNRSTVNGQVIIHENLMTRACMKDAVIHGVLEMAHTAVSQVTDLYSLNVDRNAYLKNSTLPRLVANEAVFGGSCQLFKVTSSSVDLRIARFARGLLIQDLRGATNLNASNASIGGALTIEQTSPLRDGLKTLKLAGISVTEAFTLHMLRLESADVENARLQSSASVTDLILSNRLSLYATNVDGDLLLSDIDAPIIDLSGARVARTFHIEGKAAKKDEQLLLRDTVVQTLADRGIPKCAESEDQSNCLGPWPKNIDFEGFHFSQLGSAEDKNPDDIYERKFVWWKTWLRQPHHVPQAYDTLSTVMQGAGYDSVANDIAMERRDQDQKALQPPHSMLMLLWGLADGYGHAIYYALLWAALFLLLGTFILYCSGEYKRHDKRLGLAYSFDMLVPLVFLEKEHEAIRLETWARYYFYTHKIVGYVLATFLVAGLSVLAK